MPDFNAFYESFFSDCHQEEESMDWEDVPFLPEISAPFVPSRPPRKMRSLISVQVSESPSPSSFSQPLPEHEGSRSEDYTIYLRGCFVALPGCPEELLKRAASRNQSGRPPSGVPRAMLFFERYLRTIATMPTFKLTRQASNPVFACVVSNELTAKCFVSYK
ncbi:hypothetical protein TNCV_1302661 [Trichonephila clavipes]|nr:hypothetical protein TNCV_1302661 [Trichonephila clavipes]